MKKKGKEPIIVVNKFFGMENNVFFLPIPQTENEFIQIDTGMDKKDFKRINGKIKKEWRIKYIIITHCHFDHTANLEGFKKLFPECKILMHKKCYDYVKNGEQELVPNSEDTLSKIMGIFGKKKDEKFAFSSEDVLTFSDEDKDSIKQIEEDCHIELIHTPGHTAGSLSLVDKTTNFVYIGDIANKKLFGDTLRFPFEVPSWKQLLESYEKILKIKPERLYLSHYNHNEKFVTAKEIEELIKTRDWKFD